MRHRGWRRPPSSTPSPTASASSRPPPTTSPPWALPTPSLDEWGSFGRRCGQGRGGPARAVVPLPTRCCCPAADAGAGALPSSDGESGGMVSGLLEFHRPGLRHRRRQRQSHRRPRGPGARPAQRGPRRRRGTHGRRHRLRAAGIPSPSSARASTSSNRPGRSPTPWSRPCSACSSSRAPCWPTCCLHCLSFRFLFGILGWILNVAIAILAVTVFAAAHVTREDGDRLTVQATRQGWLFLPALVLRPALMLLGLILGYFVFLAGIELFQPGMAAADARRGRFRRARTGRLPRHARALRHRRLRADERLPSS